MSNTKDSINDNIIVREGDSPINFNFYDKEGKKYELNDMLGRKKLIVYFYPKDFTPGCSIQAEEFTKDYDKFRENEIEIIGISPDSEESHLKFREKFNIPYMLASDNDNTISKRYGVYGLKKFMGKEYYGTNRSTFLIDKNRKIIKIFSKVKPTNHSKEVLSYFLDKKI